MPGAESILNYVDGFHSNSSISKSVLPFAAEAAWSAGRWQQLEKLLTPVLKDETAGFLDFNVGIGRALLAMRNKQEAEFTGIISALRESIAKSLSASMTASIQACHDKLVKLHAIYELEAVGGMNHLGTRSREVILENLNRRLDIVGAYISDKQYLLGLRRAAMGIST